MANKTIEIEKLENGYLIKLKANEWESCKPVRTRWSIKDAMLDVIAELDVALNQDLQYRLLDLQGAISSKVLEKELETRAKAKKEEDEEAPF